ncbi:hypothetical protein L345_14148, partial [Ophiophagus hannah]
MQQRFRSPSNPPAANGGAPCQGDAQEVRECHTICTTEIALLWSDWTPWSPCSKTCFYAPDLVGTRKRFRHCNGTSQAVGCDGETVQEEECETPLCPGEPPKRRQRAQCPPNMVYLTAEECLRKGGACPRLCLDRDTQVECASPCRDGCHCPEGLYLQNGSCVPLSQCLCYHQGESYPPGAAIRQDSCNNW